MITSFNEFKLGPITRILIKQQAIFLLPLFLTCFVSFSSYAQNQDADVTRVNTVMESADPLFATLQDLITRATNCNNTVCYNQAVYLTNTLKNTVQQYCGDGRCDVNEFKRYMEARERTIQQIKEIDAKLPR